MSSGTLRFQSPLKYNDPFDSQWDFLWPVHTPEAQSQLSELLERAIRDQSSWPLDIDPARRDALIREREKLAKIPSAEADSRISTLKNQIHDTGEASTARFHDLILNLLQRMRVCCLCENSNSVLMWSHYACEHRGVVLGFDTAALELTLRCPLEPVEYLLYLPKLIDADDWAKSAVFGLADPELQGAPRLWALSKSDVWSYEREWRFVSVAARGKLGDFEDFRFPRAALVELVLGCKINEQEATELRTLATTNRYDIKTIALKRHSSRFELIGTLLPEK